MLKRLAAFLAALGVLFSAVPSFAGEWDEDGWDFGDDEAGFDEEEETVDFRTIGGYNIQTYDAGDFRYELTDDGENAVLVAYKGLSPDVLLPETVNDIPVIGVNVGMCQWNSIIETLLIPGCIRSIGTNAFANCKNLKRVEIREGLTTLEICCFGGCDLLEEISFPESLETVYDCAFANCPMLHEIKFGSRLQSIGRQAFMYCAALSRVTIPGGDAVTIGEKAFDECADNLTIVN